MSRFRSSFLLTLAFLFSAGSVLAGNIAVGACKPKLESFSTISEAVAAAPAGSTVSGARARRRFPLNTNKLSAGIGAAREVSPEFNLRGEYDQ
jgi:hypothetical protein